MFSYFKNRKTIMPQLQFRNKKQIFISNFVFQFIKITKWQFARIHTSSLINIEKILNRAITKFYNGDDVNVIAAELRLTKTRLTSFHKKNACSQAAIRFFYSEIRIFTVVPKRPFAFHSEIRNLELYPNCQSFFNYKIRNF